MPTLPMSRTRTGVPFCAATTMFSTSASDWMRPMPRMVSAYWPCGM